MPQDLKKKLKDLTDKTKKTVYPDLFELQRLWDKKLKEDKLKQDRYK